MKNESTVTEKDTTFAEKAATKVKDAQVKELQELCNRYEQRGEVLRQSLYECFAIIAVQQEEIEKLKEQINKNIGGPHDKGSNN